MCIFNQLDKAARRNLFSLQHPSRNGFSRSLLQHRKGSSFLLVHYSRSWLVSTWILGDRIKEWMTVAAATANQSSAAKAPQPPTAQSYHLEVKKSTDGSVTYECKSLRKMYKEQQNPCIPIAIDPDIPMSTSSSSNGKWKIRNYQYSVR